MTFEMFLITLGILSTVTGLLTEGFKTMLGDLGVKYASNILAAIIAVIVGASGTAIFYIWNDIAWTSTNIIIMFLMMIANWLGAMLGYDKVIQTIKQMR